MTTSSGQATPPGNAPASQWGYLHPDCHGENALVFFTWDLGRVIELTLQGQADMEAALPSTQAAVDALLQQYIDRKALPEAFDGQSITLRIHSEPDENGEDSSYVALQTSPHLEQRILESQARLQNVQQTSGDSTH